MSGTWHDQMHQPGTFPSSVQVSYPHAGANNIIVIDKVGSATHLQHLLHNTAHHNLGYGAGQVGGEPGVRGEQGGEQVKESRGMGCTGWEEITGI